MGAVIYLYGASSEVAWFFLLGYLIWGLSIAGFVYSRWNFRGLSGRIGVAGAIPGPDSPVDALPESLLRTGPLPAPIFEGDRIQLEVAIESAGGSRGPARLFGRVAGAEVCTAAGVVPAQGWHQLRELGEVRRGPVRAEAWVLESSDPLGFFKHRSRRPEAEVALVLPAFASLAEQPRYRELESSLPAPRASSGSELFGVREYQTGDSLRRIHWRASAKHGHLVVREFEPPGMRAVGIVLDPDPPSREAADQAARIAASEAWDCIRAGGQVALWAPGLEGTAPAEARNLWALLEWLARYPRLPADETVPRLGGELVAIATRPDSLALDELDPARRRGAEGRAWLVGDFAVATQHPARRAGLRWPL